MPNLDIQELANAAPNILPRLRRLAANEPDAVLLFLDGIAAHLESLGPRRRKTTKFQTCERHRWLLGEGRRRRAEFFVEGGPAGQAGCEGGTCRLWPGLDIFEPSVCTSEMALDWTTAPAEPELCGCGTTLDANGEHDGGYGAWCG